MRRKKITKSGGITIPRDTREWTGLLPGVPVDVEENNDGTAVIIRKHTAVCRFCGKVDDVDVKEALGIEICKSCAEKIVEAFYDERRDSAS